MQLISEICVGYDVREQNFRFIYQFCRVFGEKYPEISQSDEESLFNITSDYYFVGKIGTLNCVRHHIKITEGLGLDLIILVWMCFQQDGTTPQFANERIQLFERKFQ